MAACVRWRAAPEMHRRTRQQTTACCWANTSRAQARADAAAAAGPSPSTCSSSSSFHIRRLQPDDLPSIKRLHKFSKFKGQPVFGADLSGVEEMLEHAAAETSGALGLVILSCTGDACDLVGAVSAQVEEGPAGRQQGKAAAAGGEAEAGVGGAGAGAAAGALVLVLLSVVVRADQRQLGAGRALLQALHDMAANSLGVARVVTDVAAVNQPAIGFFSSLGYTASPGSARAKTLEFVLDLAPTAAAH